MMFVKYLFEKQWNFVYVEKVSEGESGGKCFRGVGVGSGKVVLQCSV